MDDKSYSWDAEGYARHSRPQQEWGDELIAKLGLQGAERLLDIGCGDGKLTAKIARSLPKGSAIGIDSSKEMIELARSQYPEDSFPNLRFHQIDARKLPYHGEFDIIFSNAALHWIRNHASVLQGISRSLKADGRVLIQMGGKGNGAQIIRAAEEVIRRNRWKGYFTDFTFPYGFYAPEPYRQWLEKNGLDPVRVELIPRKMVHETQEALVAWLQNVFLPYTERLPQSKRRRFIEDLIKKYSEYHPADEQGQMYVQMVRLEVEAKKRFINRFEA